MKTQFLILWWMAQVPYAALMENRVAAEAAANVRNGIMVVIVGGKVTEVLDWYRRNDEGRPMPAERRDLGGQMRWGQIT